MKYFLLLIFMISFCFGQTYDTTGVEYGKPGGYQRIRELDAQGNVKNIRFTTWKEGGTNIQEYWTYDEHNKLISRVESTFNSIGKLVGFRITKDAGTREMEFAPEGTLLRDYISLDIAGKYVIYRKDYDGSWRYSALTEGNPPLPVPIDESAYAAAENCFTDHPGEQCLTETPSLHSSIVAEFTGNNIRNTTPFVVSSPWKVEWDAKGNFFSIYLYAEDGHLINVLGNQTLPGEGSSYYPKSGKYYFSVSTVGDWSLKVVKSE